MTENLHDQLMSKIMVLNKTVWSGARITRSKVDAWLSNFSGEVQSKESERLNALYLLSHFLFFGVPEFRELLRVVYRDLYLYPIIQNIRSRQDGTSDYSQISGLVDEETAATRFIGMGHPSESGSMLLYLFRQINNIDVDKFVYSHQIFSRYGNATKIAIRNRAVRHYVFIDDLCGSGMQAIEYSQDIISELKKQDPKARAYYFVLFSTATGIDTVRRHTAFDSVECVCELDESFKAFHGNSRHFASSPPEVGKDRALEVFTHYGKKLWKTHPLGFEDGQLLIGFWHNTPDNTLPLIWYNENKSLWMPIFERFHKL